MKSLEDFKKIVEEDKKDYSKFDALVRAGLGNKAQIQRMHQILNKMGEEKPTFTPADRTIIQNLFNKMVEVITNNPQIFRQTKTAVREDVIDTADYKLSKSGKKTKAHRIYFGKDEKEDEKKEVKEEFDINEIYENQPPFVLLLKRTAIRSYPGNMKVAIYHNDKLNKDFAVPFVDSEAGMIQAESVMDTLHKIVDGKSAQSVKFASGETRKVDHYTASAITQVHKALNDDNKKKVADMMAKSNHHMSKAVDFAWKNVK